MMVTGPSFVRLTCISAPKMPLSGRLPDSVSSSAKKDSYNGIAYSGLAA